MTNRGGVHLLVMCGALVWVLSQPLHIRTLLAERKLTLLALAAFATVVPQLWIWLESDAFFAWQQARFGSKGEYDTPLARFSRDEFKMHVDNAKSVWTAVIAIFAGIFLKK